MFKRRDFRWVERNRLVSSSNFFFFFSFFLHVECVEYEMFFYCSIFIIVFLFVSLFRLASPFCDQSSRWRRPGSSRIVVQVTPERLTIAAAFQFAASNACTELGKKKEEKLSYNNNSTKFDFLLYRLDFHSFPFYLVFLLLLFFCVCYFLMTTTGKQQRGTGQLQVRARLRRFDMQHWYAILVSVSLFFFILFDYIFGRDLVKSSRCCGFHSDYRTCFSFFFIVN